MKMLTMKAYAENTSGKANGANGPTSQQGQFYTSAANNGRSSLGRAGNRRAGRRITYETPSRVRGNAAR